MYKKVTRLYVHMHPLLSSLPPLPHPTPLSALWCLHCILSPTVPFYPSWHSSRQAAIPVSHKSNQLVSLLVYFLLACLVAQLCPTLFFFPQLFIYLCIFYIVVDPVIHWNETAMGLHVFPIPIPLPPPSPPNPSRSSQCTRSGWLLSKSLQAINAGEGVEKREPSYTVGGNAN